MSRKHEKQSSGTGRMSRQERRKEQKKYQFANIIVSFFLLVPILVFLVVSLAEWEHPHDIQEKKQTKVYEEVLLEDPQ